MATATAKRERMYDRIRQHGENLLAIFPASIERDPVKLCKKLRRLELEGERIALDHCNGAKCGDEVEVLGDALLSKVGRLLGNTGNRIVPIFVNGDPRGYALKIQDEYVREHDLEIHRDWGGYGILAPDLTED